MLIRKQTIAAGFGCLAGESRHHRTTEPHAEVGAIHPKAMPVILTTTVEYDVWLRPLWDEPRVLQRPLPDGALRIVASGERKGPGPAT